MTDAALTCEPPPTQRPNKWIVMVYMAAQGVDGETKPLFDEAEDDIREMGSVGMSERVDVFYQLHGRGRPERCHIGHGSRYSFDEPPVDFTNGRSLAGFIEWALGQVKPTPTKEDYSLLVLWGHAYRFGFGNSASANGIDAIDFEELARVFRDCQERLKPVMRYQGTPKLDVVGFDACDIATVEAVWQLQPFADFMLASQVGIPLPGWPYARILDRLANPKGRLMAPPEFGTYVVRRYCESYRAEQPGVSSDRADTRDVSLTMLDLRSAGPLFDLTEDLARELAIAMDDDPDELQAGMELFNRSQTVEGKPFVDVANLCLNLKRHSGSARVQAAAGRLGDFLMSPGPVEPGGSKEGKGRPIIMEHGRNGCDMASLQGLSLYAPHVVQGGYDWMGANRWYEKFIFSKETLWNDLVRALAQETD